MKVCVAGLRGIPDVSGGIETHCEYLYQQMVARVPGIELVVYGRRPYVNGPPVSLRPGLVLRPLPAARNAYLETISNTALAVWAARFVDGADILHIHAIGPALLAPVARLLGLRVVLTHHGDDFAREKWNRVARAALKLGERLGVASSHEIVAVSRSLAERLRADYPGRADRIRYIPNGADHILDARARDGDALARFGLTPGGYIVSVGRLVPEKGFADLIAAHRRADTGKPLVIVGGKSNSDHDEALRRAAGPDVLFTDTVPHADVAQLLRGAFLFVLASHHEGLPIAALEAAATGAPILLSDIQPNRDLMLSQRHYFPVGDVDALAARLADISAGTPDGLRTIGLVDDFAWGRIAEQTAGVYSRLAGKAERQLA